MMRTQFSSQRFLLFPATERHSFKSHFSRVLNPEMSESADAWHTWILKSRPQTVFDQDIAVADATRVHFHADLSSARLGNVAFDQLKIPAGFADLCSFHFRIHSPLFSIGLFPTCATACAGRFSSIALIKSGILIGLATNGCP